MINNYIKYLLLAVAVCTSNIGSIHGMQPNFKRYDNHSEDRNFCCDCEPMECLFWLTFCPILTFFLLEGLNNADISETQHFEEWTEWITTKVVCQGKVAPYPGYPLSHRPHPDCNNQQTVFGRCNECTIWKDGDKEIWEPNPIRLASGKTKCGWNPTVSKRVQMAIQRAYNRCQRPIEEIKKNQ